MSKLTRPSLSGCGRRKRKVVKSEMIRGAGGEKTREKGPKNLTYTIEKEITQKDSALQKVNTNPHPLTGRTSCY